MHQSTLEVVEVLGVAAKRLADIVEHVKAESLRFLVPVPTGIITLGDQLKLFRPERMIVR
jgi:hypothetical protein